MIKAAQELSEIYEKKIEERTEKDNRKIKIFESLKCLELDESKILDSILDLTVGEDKKEIYLKRYVANHKLLKEEPELEEILDDGIVQKPINLNVKDMGKALLTGENAVDLVEVMETRKMLERDANHEK